MNFSGALRCSHGHVTDVRGGLLFVKFIDPALIERFRHAGPGLNQHCFFLATNSGRKQKHPSEKNHKEHVRSDTYTILSILRKILPISASRNPPIVTPHSQRRANKLSS